MTKSRQEEFPNVDTGEGPRREPVRSKFAGETLKRINVPLKRLNAGDSVAFQFDGTD